MNKNVKYKNYRIGPHLFTVQFIRFGDPDFPCVQVKVWEHHSPRNSFIHRLIDFFKYDCYTYSTWHNPYDDGDLDDFAIHLCGDVVARWTVQEKSQKIWDNLS